MKLPAVMKILSSFRRASQGFSPCAPIVWSPGTSKRQKPGRHAAVGRIVAHRSLVSWTLARGSGFAVRLAAPPGAVLGAGSDGGRGGKAGDAGQEVDLAQREQPLCLHR